MERNLRFKIDRAGLIVRRILPFLLCFTLHLRAISNYKPLGGLYLEGLMHGGAYAWKGLFSEFYGMSLE